MRCYWMLNTFLYGLINGGVYEQIIRLLATHPIFKVTMMTADRKAGQSLGSVFPHLITQVSKLWPHVSSVKFILLREIWVCVIRLWHGRLWVTGLARYGRSQGCRLLESWCRLLLPASRHHSGTNCTPLFLSSLSKAIKRIEMLSCFSCTTAGFFSSNRKRTSWFWGTRMFVQTYWKEELCFSYYLRAF